MELEKTAHFRDLDQVLHNARLRRSANLGLWLRRYFADRRRVRSQNEACPVSTITAFQ